MWWATSWNERLTPFDHEYIIWNYGNVMISPQKWGHAKFFPLMVDDRMPLMYGYAKVDGIKTLTLEFKSNSPKYKHKQF